MIMYKNKGLVEEETVEFALGDMQSIIMAFVMITIIAVIGLTLASDLKAGIDPKVCDNLYTYNATANNCYETANVSNTAAGTTNPAYTASGEGIDAIGVITGKLGLIALIIVFALIIGILYRYFNA